MEGDEKDLLARTRDFYQLKVLNHHPKKDTLGGFHYPILLSVIVSWVIVFFCIRKGTSQTGKIAFVTVLAPYFLLAVLLVRVAFLDGFGDGLIFLFKPDLSKLFTFEIWKDALVQVVFQLSIGQGIFITFASFRKLGQNIITPTIL